MAAPVASNAEPPGGVERTALQTLNRPDLSIGKGEQRQDPRRDHRLIDW
jgi:hypothetical protein